MTMCELLCLWAIYVIILIISSYSLLCKVNICLVLLSLRLLVFCAYFSLLQNVHSIVCFRQASSAWFMLSLRFFRRKFFCLSGLMAVVPGRPWNIWNVYVFFGQQETTLSCLQENWSHRNMDNIIYVSDRAEFTETCKFNFCLLCWCQVILLADSMLTLYFTLYVIFLFIRCYIIVEDIKSMQYCPSVQCVGSQSCWVTGLM